MSFSRLSVPASILVLVVLAGCGRSAAGTAHPTPTASTTASTAAVAPTPVVRGGSTAEIVNGHRVPMSLYRSLLTIMLHQASGQAQSGGSPSVDVRSVSTQAMQQVTAQELVRQYAAQHNIQVTDAEVTRQMNQDKQQLGGEKAFQAQMRQAGLTQSTYNDLVKINLLERKVAQQVAPLQKAPQPAARVRHILIALQRQPPKPARTDAAAHALAQKIERQIQHGANFAALAKKYSDDSSASKGGNLGTIFRGETVPPFEHAAFTLPLHQVGLVHSQYGYHVVEVLWRGKAAMPLQMQQQAQSATFNRWVQGQMQHATVKQLATVEPSRG